jgi:DNA gyrase subunit A
LLEILGNRVKLYRSDGRGARRGCTRIRDPAQDEIAPAGDDIDDEDLIEREDMVVTVTLGGYIKRTPLATFRAQRAAARAARAWRPRTRTSSPNCS